MNFNDFPIFSGALKKSPALISRDRVFTGEQIRSGSERVAETLSSLGVVAGDRVAILMGNTPLFACSLFAALRLRSSALLLSTQLTRREIESCTEETGVRVLLSEREPAGLRDDPRQTTHFICEERYGELGRLSVKAFGPKSVNQDRVGWSYDCSDAEFTLQLTSGVGGESKIVPRTHANISEELRSFARTINVTPGDVVLCPAP